MKSCRIAILGATGAVGRTMLQVLEEQTDWPALRGLASSFTGPIGQSVCSSKT